MAQKIDIIRQLKRSLNDLDLDKVEDMELQVRDIIPMCDEERLLCGFEFANVKPVGVEMNLKIYWKRNAKD